MNSPFHKKNSKLLRFTNQGDTVVKKNIKLSAKEQSVLDESSLQQIDPFNIDFEEGGRQKLRMSVFQILQKCSGRDRSEQLMTDEAYFINRKGQLIIVLSDAEHDPFVVLSFEPHDFFWVQKSMLTQSTTNNFKAV